MASQSRGAPYPLAADANNTAADIQALSLWVNDRPGVAALTTTQRNALTGVELWDGRVILNTTTDRLNRYDAGTTSWVVIPDNADIGALLATTGTPAALGTASRGVSTSAARADHVHPAPAFASYTPAKTGFTVSSESARWIDKFGEVTVNYRGVLNAAVTGNIAIALPVAAANTAHGPVGKAIASDGGVTNYGGLVVLGSTTTVVFIPMPSSGGTWGATNPFTWGNTDTLQFTFSYERA